MLFDAEAEADMKLLCVIGVLCFFLSIGCDSVTEPDEPEGGGGGGSGGGATNRYITLLQADISVMNSHTSQPVGGASVTVSAGSTSCSGYSNSQGLASLSKETSIKINDGTYGIYVDISVSAPSFSSVTIEDYLVELTFLESGSGWAHYGAIFNHTVNITPDSGSLVYSNGVTR